jgi:hypothetical protein
MKVNVSVIMVLTELWTGRGPTGPGQMCESAPDDARNDEGDRRVRVIV